MGGGGLDRMEVSPCIRGGLGVTMHTLAGALNALSDSSVLEQ